mgnify:CR=1 FL=1
MLTLKTRATRTSRTVSYTEFKKGNIVDQKRMSFTPTTVIPDVLDNVLGLCAVLDSKYVISILAPNSPTTASIDLSIAGEGYKVVCERRLVRGLLPLNPFAAEFGGNYDLIFTVEAEPKLQERFKDCVADFTYEESNS